MDARANALPDHFQVPLAPGGTFVLRDAAGVEVACMQGTLWLTLDDDPRDIILERGERFYTTEHRRAIVYAFGEARVDVRRADAQAAQPSMRRRLAKNSSDWSRSPTVWTPTRAATSG